MGFSYVTFVQRCAAPAPRARLDVGGFRMSGSLFDEWYAEHQESCGSTGLDVSLECHVEGEPRFTCGARSAASPCPARPPLISSTSRRGSPPDCTCGPVDEQLRQADHPDAECPPLWGNRLPTHMDKDQLLKLARAGGRVDPRETDADRAPA